MWNDPGAVALVEQQLDGAAAVFAVIERALVHVHADELVSQLRLEVACELHGVLQSLRTMIERVLNARAQRLADLRHRLFAQTAADGVAAERQRKSVLVSPPLSEIDDLVQPGFRERELAFVDDESGFVLAF